MTYRFKSMLTATAVSLSLWVCAIYAGVNLMPSAGPGNAIVHTASVE